MDWNEEAEIEPLGEVEQAMLDRQQLVVGPQGCHWIDDSDQYCNKPLARLPSRSPYCEEHLRRRMQVGTDCWRLRAGMLNSHQYILTEMFFRIRVEKFVDTDGKPDQANCSVVSRPVTC